MFKVKSYFEEKIHENEAEREDAPNGTTGRLGIACPDSVDKVLLRGFFS